MEGPVKCTKVEKPRMQIDQLGSTIPKKTANKQGEHG